MVCCCLCHKQLSLRLVAKGWGTLLVVCPWSRHTWCFSSRSCGRTSCCRALTRHDALLARAQGVFVPRRRQQRCVRVACASCVCDTLASLTPFAQHRCMTARTRSTTARSSTAAHLTVWRSGVFHVLLANLETAAVWWCWCTYSCDLPALGASHTRALTSTARTKVKSTVLTAGCWNLTSLIMMTRHKKTYKQGQPSQPSVSHAASGEATQ